MTEAEDHPEKFYYTIGEVAQRLDVNPSLLRFWETEFKGITPHKNKKGNRLYTKKDLDLLIKIYELVKVQGYTLQGAKDKLKSKTPVEKLSGEADLKQTLINMKSFLLELREKLSDKE